MRLDADAMCIGCGSEMTDCYCNEIEANKHIDKLKQENQKLRELVREAKDLALNGCYTGSMMAQDQERFQSSCEKYLDKANQLLGDKGE